MKYLILVLVLLVTGCNEVSRSTTTSSDNAWYLTANGADLRIYEFTPKTARHMQCVFIAGENKGGLQCFEKKAKE